MDEKNAALYANTTLNTLPILRNRRMSGLPSCYDFANTFEAVFQKKNAWQQMYTYIKLSCSKVPGMHTISTAMTTGLLFFFSWIFHIKQSECMSTGLQLSDGILLPRPDFQADKIFTFAAFVHAF